MAAIQSSQDGTTPEVQDQKPQSLSKCLVSSLEENMKLASEIAALKEQLASKESSWETEKAQIVKALKTERTLRKQAEAGWKAKEREAKQPTTTKPRPQEEGISSLQHKLQDLQNNLLDARNTNAKLVSEVTALKKQMATKESSWQRYKSSILSVADGEKALRVKVQGELETLKREMDEEIISLAQSLLHEQEKTFSACEELNNVTAHYEELETCMRQDLTTEWEKKWHTAQENMALELQTREEHHVREMTEVIREKDELISKESRDKKALEEQSLELKARLEEMERKIIQSEAEWKLQLTTLEDQKRCEVSAEEGSSSSTDLHLGHLHPQELQQTPEKSKVVITKAEIKEAAKKLEKERKEKEEREKKEKERREKQEKKDLKRQKKEQKEREEKEKKDSKRRQQEELKRQEEEKQAREEEEEEVRAVTPHPPMRRARRVIHRMSAWFSAASSHSPVA